ncbi:MAG: YfhO family protein [Aureispira sp.]|nr:YfhO family protein [Aureispira sp.]
MGFWKKNKTILLLLLAQFILCLIAFNKYWMNPGDSMFMDLYDGIKNYFTFQAYLDQDASLGFTKLVQQGYPYGDYIFYTDMTPTIAVPIKLFSTYIYDISSYGIPIFNFIIILLHCFSVVLTYKILKYFVKTPWILWVLSISLTWTNPQFFRIQNGHFNLHITLFILWCFLMLIQIYKGHQESPQNYFSTHKKKLAALGILVYFAAFTHLYFLPILGVCIAFFALFYALHLKTKQQQTWSISLSPVLALGLTSFISLVAVFSTIWLTDSYYGLRDVGNPGYDVDAWKLTLSSLFTARHFNGFKFIFSYNGKINYESNLYLGAFVLYGLSFLVMLKIWKRDNTSFFKKAFAEQPILAPFLGIGVICILIGMGDFYTFSKDGYTFINYLNPFFHIHKFTSQIEQFRCLARFVWPTFWVFSFAMAYLADYYWRQHSSKVVQLTFGALVLLSVVDAKDIIGVQQKGHAQNYFHQSGKHLKSKAIKDTNLQKYQAILPVPYINTGGNGEGFNLDGNAAYSRSVLLFSVHTGLPLMSTQSSRIPQQHTEDLFSIFLEQKPNEQLLKQLNDKPILVVYHKGFNQNITKASKFRIPSKDPSKSVVLSSKQFPGKYQLTKIAEDPTYILFEWNIAQLKSN